MTGISPRFSSGDDVGAAARRVGVDRLAVRQHDDHEQHDRRRPRAARACRTRRARSRPGRRSTSEDLVGGVRRRRDRVGREDRQGDPLAQPLVVLVRRRDRATDEDPLGQRARPYVSRHRTQPRRSYTRRLHVHVVIVGCGRVGSSLGRRPHRRRPHGRGHRPACRRRSPGSAATSQATTIAGHRLRPRPARSRPASSRPAPSPR